MKYRLIRRTLFETCSVSYVKWSPFSFILDSSSALIHLWSSTPSFSIEFLMTAPRISSTSAGKIAFVVRFLLRSVLFFLKKISEMTRSFYFQSICNTNFVWQADRQTEGEISNVSLVSALMVIVMSFPFLLLF